MAHDEARRKLCLGGAFLDYVLADAAGVGGGAGGGGGAVLDMTHTFTPVAERGKGLGARLVRAGLALAAERGLRVRPSCSFVAALLAKGEQGWRVREGLWERT